MFYVCLALHRQLFARQQLLCYGVEEQFEVELSFVFVLASACYHSVALQRRLGVDYVSAGSPIERNSKLYLLQMSATDSLSSSSEWSSIMMWSSSDSTSCT